MNWLCIPGWATTPEIFNDIIPANIPFERFDFNFFNNKDFNTGQYIKTEGIICFSQGSLTALQIAQKSDIKRIIFIGGFTFFPGHDVKTGKLRKMKINLMIRGLKKNREKTLNDFYIEADLPLKAPTTFNVTNLIHGLELLRDCDMSHALTEIDSEIETIHAREDKIIPESLHKIQFKNARHYRLKGNHGSFLSQPDELKQILTEIL